ncbi:Reverse transcriptase (RNA-dependent DNA polymerase) [Nesidiocoris tenuis]|uniref:Reverse transcriptase (RNA-dependent DNA polymerase) n=1 Tax=Nesidiocoris tenuis TaxID=355587 RepID=A0ABN7A939_9HEMI|nr:Reverse transcriptase (RNA-dependent DNA polymerase) [Nesidiocoris tenuis]
MDKVKRSLQKFKNGKAPRPNGHKGETMLNLGELNLAPLKHIYSSCMEIGYFPKPWKAGKAVMVHKGNGKPYDSPAGYRIIQLLDVEGKGLERIVKERLEKYIKLEEEQYGFMPDRSTTDVLMRIVEERNTYVLLVCVDISGAFDNLWWPMLLTELQNAKIPGNLFRIIKSYLKERRTSYSEAGGKRQVQNTKGCPQGSVLGPYFWNLVANTLIKRMKERNAKIYMYADDGTLVIKGNSRKELERKGQEAINIVQAWCKEVKMRLSATKTVMTLIKGRLDTERPPALKVDGARIRYEKVTRILGLLVDEMLSFNQLKGYKGITMLG